ncbi:MAG: CysS/YqeB C-terminal domain-containing protein [Streptosporangiaceae bacterium]
MSASPRPRVLAIMGSGETSPTMVTVHKKLAARLGSGEHSAVLLDTPYAFQENAADISARAQAYFHRSVGLDVAVVTDADRPAEQNPAAPAAIGAIRTSDWVFAGPGSPSYALGRWRGGPVASALAERIAAGAGVTVIASAAAAAIGVRAVPVYEIYKAGADPHWLDGLDLLSVIGLKVVLIPHYDNAEGGTHDTRFCYLGERRLAILEAGLPSDVAVLGVDEHTALVFDLQAGQAEVLGRGGATVRGSGVSTVLPAGSVLSLADLRSLTLGGGPAGAASGRAAADGRAAAPRATRRPVGAPAWDAGAAAPGGQAGLDSLALPEITQVLQDQFAAAEAERSSKAMVAAVLDLEAAIEAWAADTDENDNPERARAVLRGLVTRLGQAADRGLADPAERLKPAVDALLDLRARLRQDGSYEAADEIRDALTAAGIEVRDSPEGTRWSLAS